jgi:hypothetical protein
VRWRDLGLETLGIGVLAVASGISLLIGYLTPFGGVVAGLVGVSSNVLWFQTPSPNSFDTRLATTLATCIAGALVCLGPGGVFNRRSSIRKARDHYSRPFGSGNLSGFFARMFSTSSQSVVTTFGLSARWSIGREKNDSISRCASGSDSSHYS